MSNAEGDTTTAARMAIFHLSLRAAVAAGLATALAQCLGLPFPIYAMISAVIVTDLDPSRTRGLGFPRLMGTVLGATLGALMCSALQSGPVEVGLGILVAMSLCHILRLRDAAKVAGYVCAIVVLDHGAHPWAYALYRTIETVIGIGLAILVSLTPRLLRPSTSAS